VPAWQQALPQPLPFLASVLPKGACPLFEVALFSLFLVAFLGLFAPPLTSSFLVFRG